MEGGQRKFTVAEFLVAGGLPLDWKYRSLFGRAAAAVYRGQYGRDPERVTEAVDGVARTVFAYRPSELHVLEAGWLAFPQTAHLPVPTLEAAMSVTFTADGHGEPVNMANANAAVVLDVLGLTESCGDEDPEQFLGRVLVAVAITPDDEGRPAETRGRFTDCGRPVGYLQRRLADLRGLAEHALRSGLRVTWG
ncbi:hypothetical protein [Streptomyces synnematoformans]|uniref:Uncharacterized protein n=1 Tax=Streptomyces synnematoformans TaxID=415721 RepID=A0ABN2XD67_9ACTN